MSNHFDNKLSEAKNRYFPEEPKNSKVDQVMEGFLDAASNVAGKIASGVAKVPGKLKDLEKSTAQAAELSKTDGFGAVKQLMQGSGDSKLRAKWDSMSDFQRKQYDTPNKVFDTWGENDPKWARYVGLTGFNRFKVETAFAKNYAHRPDYLKDLGIIKQSKPRVKPGDPDYDKHMQDKYDRLPAASKQKYTFDQYKQIQSDFTQGQ